MHPIAYPHTKAAMNRQQSLILLSPQPHVGDVLSDLPSHHRGWHPNRQMLQSTIWPSCRDYQIPTTDAVHSVMQSSNFRHMDHRRRMWAGWIGYENHSLRLPDCSVVLSRLTSAERCQAEVYLNRRRGIVGIP